MPIKPPLLPLLLLLALALALEPARASAPAPSHGAPPKSDGAEEPKPEEGNSVALPILIAPMVQGSRLAGYVYLTIRLNTASFDDAGRLRDVLPLVQDRLLRALHQSPVPASEAESPEAREAVLRTVKGALGTLHEISGVQDVALTEYQSVPF